MSSGVESAPAYLAEVPAIATLGLRCRVSDEGVHVTVEHDGRWESALGPVGPGLAALVADSASGTAVALVDRQVRLSTTALTLDLFGAPPGSGVVEAVARVEGARPGPVAPLGSAPGDFVAAIADLRDGTGRTFGRATSWWARRPGGPPLRVAEPPPGPEAGEPADALSRTLGLDGLLRGDGTVAFRLVRVGDLCNRSYTLHGGVGALLAQLAAVASLDPGTRVPQVLSLSVEYHRAAGTDGGPVHVTGTRVRQGRTSAVARGEIATADGRPALVATATIAFRAAP